MSRHFETRLQCMIDVYNKVNITISLEWGTRYDTMWGTAYLSVGPQLALSSISQLPIGSLTKCLLFVQITNARCLLGRFCALSTVLCALQEFRIHR